MQEVTDSSPVSPTIWVSPMGSSVSSSARISKRTNAALCLQRGRIGEIGKDEGEDSGAFVGHGLVFVLFDLEASAAELFLKARIRAQLFQLEPRVQILRVGRAPF